MNAGQHFGWQAAARLAQECADACRRIAGIHTAALVRVGTDREILADRELVRPGDFDGVISLRDIDLDRLDGLGDLQRTAT